RIDKDQLRRTPGKRLGQLFWNESQIRALLVGVPRYAAEALGKCLGVAVLATGADLHAAANGVPGGISPLDLGIKGHMFQTFCRPNSSKIYVTMFSAVSF